jgi:ribose-phosphate pyrophosphokinase
MKSLNLSDISKSDIKYKISRFPDGQQDIVIDEYPATKSIQIQSRFNSFKDLELIIAANKALRRMGYNKISLYIPYILGARSDRQFQEGGTSYLVDVIAPILNAQKFKYIQALDVHSDVAAACIENLIVTNNYELVEQAIAYLKSPQQTFSQALENFILVSPDAGAQKKISKLAEVLEFKGKIITASKHRSVDGTLTETQVPVTTDDLYSAKDFLIVDDICDGGRTFIEIAKVIKAEQERHNQLTALRGKLYLIVTHGIFSNRLKELNKYFDLIFCTNSVQNIGKTVYDGYHEKKSYVVQFPVI